MKEKVSKKKKVEANKFSIESSRTGKLVIDSPEYNISDKKRKAFIFDSRVSAFEFLKIFMKSYRGEYFRIVDYKEV